VSHCSGKRLVSAELEGDPWTTSYKEQSIPGCQSTDRGGGGLCCLACSLNEPFASCAACFGTTEKQLAISRPGYLGDTQFSGSRLNIVLCLVFLAPAPGRRRIVDAHVCACELFEGGPIVSRSPPRVAASRIRDWVLAPERDLCWPRRTNPRQTSWSINDVDVGCVLAWISRCALLPVSISPFLCR
jgi:hypothetical protein